MASMVCPNCKAPTNRLIFLPTVRGDEPVVVCDGCRHVKGDAKLYTGKKFWPEHQVYSPDQVKERNYQYEQNVKKEVAANYKNMRKSTRKAMFGY